MAVKLRHIRIEGNIAYVYLTKGYIAIIDAADVNLIYGFNWCADVNRNTVYAKRNLPRNPDGRRQKIRIHNVIIKAPRGFIVDHINGDGLDNRRENLRIATVQQNICNQGKRISNTSGVKGVGWNKRYKKWEPKIWVNGKCVYLGRFFHLQDAATAYALASKKFHGEFGRTI